MRAGGAYVGAGVYAGGAYVDAETVGRYGVGVGVRDVVPVIGPAP
ncbi:hypothetical protein tb265_43900 [Gemmatimonadetes bacterium T265]|nr:hypothetical protein tb265_43900 [Gemmatimonadetes bacterium T265]